MLVINGFMEGTALGVVRPTTCPGSLQEVVQMGQTIVMRYFANAVK